MSVMLKFVSHEIYDEIIALDIDEFEKAALIADICRINTFSMVKQAGSGHLGTSFSAMDIFVWLFYFHLNTHKLGFNDPNRDIFFSSKGHDVPGMYSVYHSLGLIPLEKIRSFRRLGGLDGHPDINLPGIEANTGSLGMGISKAKGMAWAKARSNFGGRVFVMTGDGELQEGQIFESMQTCTHQKVNNITAIVDRNFCQTENSVDDVISLGDLKAKFTSFGWHAEECNGHDFKEIKRIMSSFEQVVDKPKILICETIKGKGISFMEHPKVLEECNGKYRFHAGAPSDHEFNQGLEELISNVTNRIKSNNLKPLKLIEEVLPQKVKSKVSSEFTAVSFTDALIDLAAKREDIVLLDADLLGDAKLQRFQEKYPDRFIENGIAEQDMVSAAGGLALQGYLPVVNSFASFLCARANEQIYNNATELTKIIYINLYAGLIPAGPGKSHQSLRDIALMSTMPNITVVHGCNEKETKALTNWAAEDFNENVAIRLSIGPSPRITDFPTDWTLEFGRWTTLYKGEKVLLLAYGPVMIHEALTASEILNDDDVSISVASMPWLNRFDLEWISKEVENYDHIFVLEDHGVFGGLGDHLFTTLNENCLLTGKNFTKFGIKEFPKCGTPPEVLRYHGLDGHSLAKKITEKLNLV